MRRILWIMIILAAGLLAACGGGSGEGPAEEAPGGSAAVAPMPDSSPEMTVALADGTLPCGIGQVQWGFQIFEMGDYPGCTATNGAVTVYCLTGDAQWSDENVSEVSASAGAVSFTSTQEGICGLFPTN